MAKRADNWEAMLTPSGAPNADYRARFGILDGGRFPVAMGDCERAESALRLRGNGTTKQERRKIIRAVMERCPELADDCREAMQEDSAKGLI